MTFLGMLVCTYTYMLVWQWTGEVNATRVRDRYLQAVLRQDIAYFDELGAGEVATRIETDTHLVHSGIAEKVPTAVQYMSTFITGFVCKSSRMWRFLLADSPHSGLYPRMATRPGHVVHLDPDHGSRRNDAEIHDQAPDRLSRCHR